MNYYLGLTFFLLFLIGCRSTPITSNPDKKPIQVQGHRGSRGTHPENSFPAFEEALESGADWIELDLVLSKDEIPVVSHDPVISVDLCVDAQKKPLSKLIPVRSQSLKQLKKYDCGSVPNPLFPEQINLKGHSFVTLEEVLSWLQKNPSKSIRLNIETKLGAPNKQLEPNPKQFVEAILRLLRKYQQLDRSMLQSFDFRTLKEAKRIEPSLKLSALFDKPSDFCKLTKELGAQIASPAFSILNAQLVKDCHALGIEVHPWTLNQENEWKAAVALGVDGIITDYPRKLITFLKTSTN